VTTNASPLNIELLNETADLDPSGFNDLIAMYLAQADENSGQLRAAVRANDSEEVERLAHKLAGASAVCGVTAMVAPLRVLEQRGRDDRLAEVEALLDGIAKQLEVCRKLLNEYLKKRLA
jgi:HPt (histidine-containing phosphotransfer) domain-containing protein